MRLVVDVECYKNYFLAMFRAMDGSKTVKLERYEDEFGDVVIALDTHRLNSIMNQRETVTFNGKNYDELIISLAIQGHSCEFLKEISDAIICQNLKPWDIERQYQVNFQRFNSIDLIEVAKGQASLKIYGGRLHTLYMQDLPIDPSAFITMDDRDILIPYCGNDLDVTRDLYHHLLPLIELREVLGKEYKLDLRSKSDAQIAEAVIKSEIQATGKTVKKPVFNPNLTFKYRKPDFIDFESNELINILESILAADFTVGEGGKPIMPKSIITDKKEETVTVRVGGTPYTMGMGGLHSVEKSTAYVADSNFRLFDRDVASFYPRIILILKLFPTQLGPMFLKIYQSIVDRRLEAKAAFNALVSECLKIVINGSFGKFGSKYSVLYSPDLLIQTTITGQLSLLMLIERLERHGLKIVSANTDGIVIKCINANRNMMLNIIAQWERDTGFETEEVEYAALYSRDVNNYIAVKPDNKVKLKGAYAKVGIDKNPVNTICVKAAIEKITNGVNPSHTVMDSMDVRDFITVKRANGGAHKDGEYLGKAIRWYRSTETSTAINYVKDNKQVGGSERSMPMMQLADELPIDLDYKFYIDEAYDILREVGFYTPAPTNKSIRRDRALVTLFDEVVG